MLTQYDAFCKQILRYRVVLYWILQWCDEFRGIDRDIALRCIEYRGELGKAGQQTNTKDEASEKIDGDGDASYTEISTKINGDGDASYNGIPAKIDGDASYFVNPSHHAEQIIGINGEHKSQSEGTTTFDLVFTVTLPNSEHQFDAIVNIEGQKDNDSGYPLDARGIFYCARLLSGQYTTSMQESDKKYDACRKVYSIWICFNPPAYKKNTVYRAHFLKEQIEGQPIPEKYQSRLKGYDLIEMLEVNLGDYIEDATGISESLKCLDVAFSPKIPAEEKGQILREKYGIYGTEFESEVKSMSGMGQALYDNAYNEGVLFGINEGEARGEARGETNMLRNAMSKHDWTLEQVFDFFDIPKDDRHKYEELLK